MTSKFEFFSKKKMNALYITEIMQTDWLHMLYGYWEERYTPYSFDLDFGLSGCFNISMKCH